MAAFSFEHVYQVARLVPRGRVTTCGAIARYLGAAHAARMVGWAMNACRRSAAPVPAHRIVGSGGWLTAKQQFGGNRMEQLLESEGIRVENGRVASFSQLFWDPNIELGAS